MVKPLQLLTVVVPGLSRKTDDPQVLLQTAHLQRGISTSTEHLHLHSGVQTMQTRLESMMQQAVASGDTPELDQTAYNTMIDALQGIEKQLNIEKGSNDKDWKDAVDAVQKCNDDTQGLFKAADGVDEKKSDMETADDFHKKCRPKEDTKRKDEYKKHQTMVDETKGAFNDKPDCIKHKDEGELLDDLTEAKNWGKKWTTKVKNSIDAYNAAASKADQQAGWCDGRQRKLELEMCEYEVSLRTTCSTHGTCIKRAVAARKAKRTELEAKEKAEKIILKSCSKVRCYLQLIKEGKSITQGKYDVCKNGDGTFNDADRTWNPDGTSILNINWVKIKKPDTCDTSPVDVVPGSSGWEDLKYNLPPTGDWMPGKVGIEATNTCKSHLAPTIEEGGDGEGGDGEGDEGADPVVEAAVVKAPPVQGWRVLARNTNTGIWDVSRMKIIADGKELSSNDCTPIDSAHYKSQPKYAPTSAFRPPKGNAGLWGGRKNQEGFFIGLECAAPEKVEIFLKQGHSHDKKPHCAKNIQIQKKVDGKWLAAGSWQGSTDDCGKEVKIFG